MKDKQEQHEGFIKSDDIGYSMEGGNSITLTVKSIAPAGTVTDAQKQVVDKPILYFEEAKKGLIMNSTNMRISRLLLGKQSTWVGKKLCLVVRFINAFGEKDVPTIRVTPPDNLPLPFGVRKWAGKVKPTVRALR